MQAPCFKSRITKRTVISSWDGKPILTAGFRSGRRQREPEARGDGWYGQAAGAIASDTHCFKTLLGAAPTFFATGFPSRNRISVGMPVTA